MATALDLSSSVHASSFVVQAAATGAGNAASSALLLKIKAIFSECNFARAQESKQQMIVMHTLLELLAYKLLPRYTGSAVLGDLFLTLAPLLAKTRHRSLFLTLSTLLRKILMLAGPTTLFQLVSSGFCFEQSEALNRGLVEAVVRGLCIHGQFAEDAAIAAFLNRVQATTPLRYSRHALESFPPEAKQIKAFFAAAANSAPSPSCMATIVELAKHGGPLLFQERGAAGFALDQWRASASMLVSTRLNRQALLMTVVYLSIRKPEIVPENMLWAGEK